MTAATPLLRDRARSFRALGISLPKAPGVPLAESIALAKDAEAAGFGIISVGEGAIENFSVLGALTVETTTAELFSGVATWTRTPVTTATGAATLADLSGDRYRLGLGPMPRAWSEDWHGVDYTRPVERMRDYVGAVRSAWSARPGEPVDHHGPFYTLRGYEPLANASRPRSIPVYLAVTRRRMARLAGEIADGVMLNTMTSFDWTKDVLLPEIQGGLDASGRDASALDVGIMRICEIDDDPAVAREMARHSLGFYFRVPYFAEQLEYAGYVDECARGYAAAAAGDVAGMAAAITDEILDAITLTGTPADVREALERYAELADWVLLVSNLTRSPEIGLRQTRRIISTFGRS